MDSLSVLTPVLYLLGLFHPQQAVVAASAPEVTERTTVTSLMRAHEEWTARTRIVLEARGTQLGSVMFSVTSGPRRGSLTCDASCTTPNSACTREPQSNPRTRFASCQCIYEPDEGFSGADEFQYQALSNSQASRVGTVLVDVKGSGLRWEIVTNGTTGLTSDSKLDATSIPSVIGATAQDMTFLLHWQLARPRQKSVGPATVLPFDTTSAGLKGGTSRSINFVFKTGFVSAPISVKPVDHGADSDGVTAPTPAVQPASTDVKSASTQRLLTFGAELNGNAVRNFDGVGTYVELGFSGRSSFDAALDADVATVKAGRVFELLREERGTFRWEGLARLAIKQYHENPSTMRFRTKRLLGADGQENGQVERQIYHSASSEDLVLIEAGLQRNNALDGLGQEAGDSRNRYLLRVLAMPEIPGIGGHTKALLGVEMSRATGGGPKIIRFMYGVNVGRD